MTGEVRELLLPQCPYWQHNGRNYVECEGVDDHSRIRLKFSGSQFSREHRERFCCSMDYHSCPIAGMLNEKYGYEP